MARPRVSVVVPVYNRADRLVHALDSVLAQSWTDFELIVVDDGSRDGSPDVVRDRYGDAVILLDQKVNRGVSAARNAGVRAARADLVAFLDSDDVWTPDKLAVQAPLMDDPAVVLSAMNWRFEGASALAFDDLDMPADPWRLDDPLELLSRFRGHRLWLPTWMVRRSAFLRVGAFDERMRVAEDTRVLFRLAFEGAFAVSGALGAIRSATEDAEQLTVTSDRGYQRRLTPLTVELLHEAYTRAADRPVHVQKRLRRLLAFFLCRDALHRAQERSYAMARRRALEAVALAPRPRDAALALAIAFAPGIVGRRGVQP